MDRDDRLRTVERELDFLIEEGDPSFAEQLAEFPDPEAALDQYYSWAWILIQVRERSAALPDLSDDDLLTLVQDHLSELWSELVLGNDIDGIEFEASFPEYDFWNDDLGELNQQIIAVVKDAFRTGVVPPPELEIDETFE